MDMVEIIVIVLVILFLGLLSLFFRQQTVGYAFISPVILTGVTFLLIHLIVPLWQYMESYYRYQNEYDDEMLVYSILMVLGCQIFLTLILRRQVKLRFAAANELGARYVVKVFRLTLIVLMIGLTFTFVHVRDIMATGMEGYMRDRIGYGAGKGLSIMLAHWVYISCLIFFGLYMRTGKNHRLRRYLAFFALFSFLVSCFYYSVNGNRNSIFILSLNLLAIWFILGEVGSAHGLAQRNRRVTRLLIIVPILVYGFFAIGKSRLERTGANADNYSLLRAINGAFGNHENLVWLAENDFEYHYGASYVAGVTNFVPRSLWAEKPLGGGPRLKNAIYPGTYVVGKQRNSSLTTGLYTELYLNFGLIGMILGTIVYAALLNWVIGKLRNANSLMSFQLFLFCLIAFSTHFYYAEFLGFTARTVISIIPIWIISRAVAEKEPAKLNYRLIGHVG